MEKNINVQFLCQDCENFHLPDKMRKEHLDKIRDYIVENIMRNPDYLFSDEVRGKEDTDIDLLTVIASLYEELHHEVTGEGYNYMWHFANKYGARVDDNLFVDLKEGDEHEKNNNASSNK